MKVLHIASSAGGGAGIAATRIVDAQRESGLESTLLTLSPASNTQKSYVKSLSVSRHERFRSKVLTAFQSRVLQNSDSLMTPCSLSHTEELVRISQKYDVVNFHASYNLWNYQTLTEIQNYKPVVITLHDQRLITGGCHYTLGCQNYLTNCIACPQIRAIGKGLPPRSFEKILNSIKGSKCLSLVSPSYWLFKIVTESLIGRSQTISVINNPIPSNENEIERTQGKRDDTLVVGFVSAHLNNPIKGLDTLIEAVSLAGKRRRIRLILFGKGQIPYKTSGITIDISEFNDENSRSNGLSQCHVIVVPSIVDNSPSVIGEALVRGIPVIGSRTGGITELLERFNLPLFETNDSRALGGHLENFTQKPLHQDQINLAKDLFSYSKSAERYKEVYEKLSRCRPSIQER